MGFFGMLFWIAVLYLVIRAFRRSERCVPLGPRGYAPWWYARERYDREGETYGGRGGYRTKGAESGDQQAYIDSLESRVSELEERLDFTERLLASRREAKVE